MRNQQDITVDGVKYSVFKYSTTHGLTLLGKIAKIIGEPLSILASMSKGSLDTEINADAMGQMAKSLVQNIQPEDLPNMANEILRGVEIYGQDARRRDVNFDLDFQGKFGHLFKVLKNVLQFQYEDFFGELAVVMPSTVSAMAREVKTIKAK